MAPWEEFDIAFAFKRDHSYDHKLVDQIITNRRVLDHVLFVDRLLKILGIEGGIMPLELTLSVGARLIFINFSIEDLPPAIKPESTVSLPTDSLIDVTQSSQTIIDILHPEGLSRSYR